MRFAVLISTGGAVFNETLRHDFFRDNLVIVYADRFCGGITVAKKHGIKNFILDFNNNMEFSNELLKNLKEDRIDFLVLFYTRFLVGDILTEYRYKIINLHPSLLPLCSGLDPINRSLQSGSFFIGTTIHFVDDTVDGGQPIIQSIIVHNLTDSYDQIRHKIFIDQFRTFLQVVRWIIDGRLNIINDRLRLCNMRFDSIEYAPALDEDILIMTPLEHDKILD